MKKIVLYPSGKEVEIEDGQTVLSALEQAGLALPNNCRAGACGECKVKVRSGEFDQGFILDMALPKHERENGYGLMCMAKLTGDSLEIEWEADGGPKLFPPKENLPYIVVDKNLVTPNIAKIRLRSLGESMRFWPGQYVMFGEPARPYSIGNIPNQDGELNLYITKVENGKASTWIHDQLDVGQRIKLDGPYGTFVGDPTADTPVLCLASGSGLSPILSLASAALMRGGFKNPATILFSAKTKKDIFELGFFKYLETKFRNFRFYPTLTQEKAEKFYEGRITKILPEIYSDLSDTSVYIAGNPQFVQDCVEKVKELGAKDELIHIEKFC